MRPIFLCYLSLLIYVIGACIQHTTIIGTVVYPNGSAAAGFVVSTNGSFTASTNCSGGYHLTIPPQNGSTLIVSINQSGWMGRLEITNASPGEINPPQLMLSRTKPVVEGFDLSIPPDGKRIDLTWIPYGSQGHLLYRNGSLIANLSNLSNFNDTGLENGVEYLYQLFSYDALGVLSEGVNLSGTPTDLQAPTISISSPANGSVAEKLMLDFTAIGANFCNCTILWMNSSMELLVDSPLAMVNYSTIIENLSDMNYSLSISCMDESLNENSQSVEFSIKKPVLPTILYQYPAGTINSDLSEIILNIIINTDRPCTCRYSPHNLSFPEMGAFGEPLIFNHTEAFSYDSDTDVLYHFRCRDEGGLEATGIIDFTLDLREVAKGKKSKPSIIIRNLTNPPNQSTINHIPGSSGSYHNVVINNASNVSSGSSFGQISTLAVAPIEKENEPDKERPIPEESPEEKETPLPTVSPTPQKADVYDTKRGNNISWILIAVGIVMILGLKVFSEKYIEKLS